MFCPSCGKTIPDTSQFCISCGKPVSTVTSTSSPRSEPTRPKTKHTGLAIFIFIAIAVGVIVKLDQWWYERKNPADPLFSSQVAAPVQHLEYQQDGNWKRTQYGGITIAGSVKNTAFKPYRYAQISFSLYDKSGSQVGTAWANISNLDVGATWKFEATVLEPRAHTFRFKDVSGW